MVETQSELAKKPVRDFLARPLLAKLVTLNRDGSPQITFMWYELNDGAFLFSTTKERLKAKNLARDPRIAVAIDDPENPWRGVIARGVATVSEEGALDLIERLALRYVGPERAKATRQRAMQENRVVVRMQPKRVRLIGL